MPSGAAALLSQAATIDVLSDLCRTSAETIPVCKPRLPPHREIAKYFARIDSSRRYSNHGGLLRELQDRLHRLTKCVAGVTVAASGTAALTGAILAKAGRAKSTRPLCLLPAYTFIGTVSAVEQCGYEPYFLDVDASSWMIEAHRCATHDLIDRVGLVVPVAPYGRAVPQIEWLRFVEETGVPVVIDGAAALESLVSSPEQYLGNIPVAVSFHATKSFCTGEGGAIFCADLSLCHTAMQCLNFGYDLDRVCRQPCINGKMSEYHAAVGLAELDGWAQKLAAYEIAAGFYRTWFSTQSDRLHLAPTTASNYALLEVPSRDRAVAVLDIMSHHGFGHRHWYGAGVHLQPYCLRFGRDPLPNAESLAFRLIGLPMSVDLAEADVVRIAASLGDQHIPSAMTMRVRSVPASF